MVDPEAAWQFLKRRIFDVEGIELIQRPYSTFKDTVDSLHEAEKLGACCWIVDPLTLIWNELLDSFKQKLATSPSTSGRMSASSRTATTPAIS